MFHHLLRNIFKSFWGRNLLWHLLAILCTALIVLSGFDWAYFLAVRGETLNSILFPAVIIGGILPIIFPLCVLALGLLFRNNKMVNTAWALGQAAFIGLFVSSLYKAFTGRIQPNMVDLMSDISHKFNFGFLEHGVFWGWPSSHTTVAFAMAVTLCYLFHKNRFIQGFAFLYAFYIGFGVSIGIHWFSEFVAGAIIGAVIGRVVGKTFRLN